MILDYVKSWFKCCKFVDAANMTNKGTLSYEIFSKKFLIPEAVLSKLVDEQIKRLETGY